MQHNEVVIGDDNMNIWAILIDSAKDNYHNEMIFEDRLFFAGRDKENVIEQLKAVVKDQYKILTEMLMLDYDNVDYYYPDQWCPDDCVLQVRLKEWSVRGDKNIYLYFKLILLDMKKNCTLKTSIPQEIIKEARDIVAKEFS